MESLWKKDSQVIQKKVIEKQLLKRWRVSAKKDSLWQKGFLFHSSPDRSASQCEKELLLGTWDGRVHVSWFLGQFMRDVIDLDIDLLLIFLIDFLTSKYWILVLILTPKVV